MGDFFVSKDKLMRDVVGEPLFSRKFLLYLVLVCIGIVWLLFCVKIPVGLMFFLIMVILTTVFFFLCVVLPEALRRTCIKRKIAKEEYYIQKSSVSSVKEKIFSSDSGVVHRMQYRAFFCNCKDFYDFDEPTNVGDEYYLVFLKDGKTKKDNFINSSPMLPHLLFVYKA